MSAWQGAVLAMAGMLAGVLLVVLLQLVGTLRATRRLLEELAPEVKKTARETAALAQNLNELSAPLATQGEGLARFLASLERLASTVDRLNHMAQTAGMVAAAVAPAVTAAVRALRQGGTPEPSGSPGPGGEGCRSEDDDVAVGDSDVAQAKDDPSGQPSRAP